MHKSFSPHVLKSTKSIIIFYSMGLEENIFRGINVCGMANDFFSLFPMFEIYQEYPNLEVTF